MPSNLSEPSEATAPQTPEAEVSQSTPQSALSRLAIRASAEPVQRVSGALHGAADALDELAENGPLGQNETLRDYAASASTKLRDVAELAAPEEAGRIMTALEDRARQHPVAATTIGAAIGAACGIALSRLGNARDTETRREMTTLQ